MTIFYQLHAVLIREQLLVTTDKRGTYKATPRGVLVLNAPLTTPIITLDVNTEPEHRCWKAATAMAFDREVRTAWTEDLDPNTERLLGNATPGSVKGPMAFNLLGEWWIAALSPLWWQTALKMSEVQHYEVNENRQEIRPVAKGINLAGLETLGWLMCWPWLVISPTWEAYTLETE